MEANPKYYTEINPIDKINDLMKQLAGYKVEVKNCKNEGYDWLEDYLVVSNLFSEETIEILFEEKGELAFFLWRKSLSLFSIRG